MVSVFSDPPPANLENFRLEGVEGLIETAVAYVSDQPKIDPNDAAIPRSAGKLAAEDAAVVSIGGFL